MEGVTTPSMESGGLLPPWKFVEVVANFHGGRVLSTSSMEEADVTFMEEALVEAKGIAKVGRLPRTSACGKYAFFLRDGKWILLPLWKRLAIELPGSISSSSFHGSMSCVHHARMDYQVWGLPMLGPN